MFKEIGKKLISLTTKLFTKIEYRLINGFYELMELIETFMIFTIKFP